jgi:large subunit ribosomal protein L6
MSRIGKKPVVVPSGVKVAIADKTVRVEGPKGKLSWELPGPISATLTGGEVRFDRADDERHTRALHGLSRSLVANMVEGVSKGFERRLEIVGVGYNAKLDGRDLQLQVGFARPAVKRVPEGLEIELPNPTHIVIRGADKRDVGQFAAEVRKIRPPEPYKGKGIRYEGEQIRRKAGKAFQSGAT